MGPSDGWYLFGPLLAVGLVAALGFVFWRMGLQWIEDSDDHWAGLSIFSAATAEELDDFGLLRTAAIADDPGEAEDIRLLLAEAGIRATTGTRQDGQVAVLVFAEELDAARRRI